MPKTLNRAPNPQSIAGALKEPTAKDRALRDGAGLELRIRASSRAGTWLLVTTFKGRRRTFTLGRQAGRKRLGESGLPSNALKQAVHFGRAPSRPRQQDPASKAA